jgi:hypothetical protein
MTDYEYTQMTCDAWQMHHLANRWADKYGWESVSVVSLPVGHQVPKEIGVEDSPSVDGVAPVAILFRRRIKTDFEE